MTRPIEREWEIEGADERWRRRGPSRERENDDRDYDPRDVTRDDEFDDGRGGARTGSRSAGAHGRDEDAGFGGPRDRRSRAR